MARRPPKQKARPSSTGFSQEEIAARVPCAQQTVSRYQRKGELTQLANGKLDARAVEQMRTLLAESEGEKASGGDMKRRLDTAMARLREAQAQIREIELERESGKVVERAEVERSGRDAAQRILSVLRALPKRVAGEVDAAISAPVSRRQAVIEKLIAAEVERAIFEMRQSMYLQINCAGSIDEALGVIFFLVWVCEG